MEASELSRLGWKEAEVSETSAKPSLRTTSSVDCQLQQLQQQQQTHQSAQKLKHASSWVCKEAYCPLKFV